MARRLEHRDGMIDDADSSQPRITIMIEGGLALDDRERALRDHLIDDFVDELVAAIRAFYDVRKQIGAPNRPIDAAKLAAAIAKS